MEPSSTATESTEDREYDTAWDEPEQEADASKAPPEPEPEQPEPDAEQETSATTEPPPEAPADAEPESEPAPTTDDVERVRQELKSWQGRRSKAQAEAEAEERRLAALKAQPAPAATPTPSTFDLSDEERQAIAALEADYGDISPGVNALAKRMAGELVSTQLPRLIDSQVRPLREYNEQTQALAHSAAIQAKHPDAYALRPLLEDWIGALPYRDGARYSQVLAQGSAQQVIELLDSYKNTTANVQTAAKREAQLAGSQGVRHRSGGPPKARPDSNDFDAAWDEAPDTD